MSGKKGRSGRKSEEVEREKELMDQKERTSHWKSPFGWGDEQDEQI